MENRLRSLATIAFLTGLVITVSAQDRLSLHGNVDLVSNYIWRGSDQNTGCSVQPELSLHYKGFMLSAWGNQSLTHYGAQDSQEFDLNIGYSFRGFTAMLTDYWWNDVSQSYGHYASRHHFEATLGYDFDSLLNLPLSVSWSTWFAGNDHNRITADGSAERAYSTYICAQYEIDMPADVTLTPQIGFTPWGGFYRDKASFTDFSVLVEKDVRLTDRFELPLFLQVIVSPYDSTWQTDKTYLVAGFSLGF